MTGTMDSPARPPDLIIENGTVLTMDAHRSVLEQGSVHITGDTLTYVGTDRQSAPPGARRIDARGGVILPGLVNGHTHAAMSLFRGLADDLPLMEWLNHYIFPAEQRMDGDFVSVGTLLACAEMILSGTTTFCDMYLFEREVASSARTAGMRCLVGEVLYDFPSPNYGSPENGLEYTESLIQQWRDDPLVGIAVEPHSLFTCSPDLLERSSRLARDYDVPLIIHLAETRTEVELIREKYGRGPVAHLEACGLLGPSLIADHCVHLDDDDVDRLAEEQVRVIHNPESNMKLASGIAPVPRMIAAGLRVGLGTDGCASNNNLDLLAEMDTAAKLHKVAAMDPTVLTAEQVLGMATIEGAKALGLEEAIGSLEEGKKADVIVIDMQSPHLTPLYNPYSHLVYSAGGGDVTLSVINGRVVMADRQLLCLDLEEVMALAREKGAQVRSWVS